jgi:LPXTG-motif cell wall-anchored protein
LTGVDPHSQQGWHVRLTVEAEGSIGAETKFKEFWVEGCAPPPSPTTSTTVSENVTPPTQPGGTTSTTAVMPAAPAGGGLPETGTNTAPLALAGATLVAIGAGAGVLARRFRPRHMGGS